MSASFPSVFEKTIKPVFTSLIFATEKNNYQHGFLRHANVHRGNTESFPICSNSFLPRPASFNGCFSPSRKGRSTPYEPPPYAHGTQYDCKVVVPQHGAENVWKGRFAGRLFDDGPMMKQISDTACFTTHQECRAWLSFWSGKVNGEIFQSSCRQGTGR